MDKELRFSAERVLKRETNRILNEIGHLMDEDGVGRAIADGNEQKGNRQFKNLMDATEEASCIEELLLFIAYQESKGGVWKKRCINGKSIAVNVTNSSMKVQDEVYGLIGEENDASKISVDDERELRLEIAVKYLGYLFWKVHIVSKN